MNKDRLIALFGWYGTVSIILAYALVSFSFLTPTSILYQILNGTGALGIVAISFHKKTYQPGVLNVLWAIIAFFAIGKILF